MHALLQSFRCIHRYATPRRSVTQFSYYWRQITEPCTLWRSSDKESLKIKREQRRIRLVIEIDWEAILFKILQELTTYLDSPKFQIASYHFSTLRGLDEWDIRNWRKSACTLNIKYAAAKNPFVYLSPIETLSDCSHCFESGIAKEEYVLLILHTLSRCSGRWASMRNGESFSSFAIPIRETREMKRVLEVPLQNHAQ